MHVLFVNYRSSCVETRLRVVCVHSLAKQIPADVIFEDKLVPLSLSLSPFLSLTTARARALSVSVYLHVHTQKRSHIYTCIRLST